MTSEHVDLNRIPRLAIVVPCFNEDESIVHTAQKLQDTIHRLSNEALIASDSFLLFVDDGSVDNTWNYICRLHGSNPAIKGLKLSRNFGHQAAVLAGLSEVTGRCDAAISIDADLQQDPAAIRDFVAAFRAGNEVVIGVRNDRSSDNWIKKATASGFYSFMRVMGVNIVPDHADYRLLGAQALDALSHFTEPNVFLRALCLQLGFRTAVVHFAVSERKFGRTKYSVKKMMRLAVHGITSSSVAPLRFVAILGFLFFLLSAVMAMYVLWQTLFIGNTVPGWASTILPIYFIGGVQLLCLGVVGEYIGQVYSTVKHRPRWISEHKLD